MESLDRRRRPCRCHKRGRIRELYFYSCLVSLFHCLYTLPQHSTAFSISNVIISQRQNLHICFASSEASSSSSLSSLTVKELRERVKLSTSGERGVLSKLKRKQDLIDFLVESDSSRSEGGDDIPPRKTTRTKQPRRKKSPGLPPLNSNNGAVDDDNGVSSASQPRKQQTSPKEAMFERVYQRYPPMRGMSFLDSASFNETTDVRQLYHPIIRDAVKTSSDMDVVFVGTASCTPGVTRGVSCTALRLNWKRRSTFVDPRNYNQATHKSNFKESSDNGSFQGGTWLFDAGECTQLQVQRTSKIKPSKITKIFLTHAHGDHSFGLPGLLCLMGQDRDRQNSPPVDIYGPEGLRMWLRVAVRYSVSRIVPPYRVHEIMEVPMAPEWVFSERARRFFFKASAKGKWGSSGLAGEDPINWISQANMLNLEPSAMYGELEGGRSIYPQYDHPLSSDGAPVWEVEDEEDVKVYASPMSHGIPCLGFVVEEMPRAGRLRNEVVEPLVRQNAKALIEAGFRVPMKAMAVIKDLPEGSAFTFPDGTVISQEDAVEPARPGRKIVIGGDTADCRSLTKLAENADLVIHEATNTFLNGIDRDTNIGAVTRDAVVHGHSTPYIAGNFAKRVNAKRLVLNHFSARYKGDVSPESIALMTRIEYQAMKASQMDETRVAAAWDMMVLPIPPN